MQLHDTRANTTPLPPPRSSILRLRTSAMISTEGSEGRTALIKPGHMCHVVDHSVANLPQLFF